MLQSKKLMKLGIIAAVVILAVVAIVFLFAKNQKPEGDTAVETSQTAVVSPSQTATESPTIVVTTTPSKYSAEFRAKVRSDFINSCVTKGKQEIAVCNCTADYLSKNYSEAQLVNFFVQYHTSNKLPEEVNKAAVNCNAK